jgi:hypothetical protein
MVKADVGISTRGTSGARERSRENKLGLYLLRADKGDTA